MRRNRPRIRWGVQRDMRERGKSRPDWQTLGTGWHPDRLKVPHFVDFWPMSFMTRLEAREFAKATMESSRSWSDAKFRAVKLKLITRVAS